MTDPYIGEIKMFGFGRCPLNYAKCNGQKYPKDQYETLDKLLKNKFGGDGAGFFLPDLRGRIPLHDGNGYAIGNRGGQEYVNLANENMPPHAHKVRATSNEAGYPSPDTDVYLAKQDSDIYSDEKNLVPLADHSVSYSGSEDNKHKNVQPCQVINFCIALAGIYPSPKLLE